MKNQFLFCGSVGWGLEILWTGLHSLHDGEPTLSGTSSLWMFPIYGMASLIGPVSHHLARLPFFLRGDYLRRRNLSGGIHIRLSASPFPRLPLGLQRQMPLPLQRSDPSGLRTSLVPDRSVLRKAFKF